MKNILIENLYANRLQVKYCINNQNIALLRKILHYFNEIGNDRDQLKSGRPTDKN